MAANSNNAYRLSKLLVDGGTYFARELTLEEIGKRGFASFDSFLNDHTVKNTLQNLKRRKILKNEQMILLYPHASNVDIYQLDITLLTCILINCCQLSQPQEDAVKRLRDLRNTVYGHHPLFSIPDSLFQKYWADIKTLLENESNTYLKPACENFLKDLIKRVESEILSPDDGEIYLNGLKEWNTQLFESLKEMFSTQDTKLDRLNVSMSEMNINQKIANESLKDRIDEQNSKLDRMFRQIHSLKTSVDKISQRQQPHYLKGVDFTDKKAQLPKDEWLEEKIRNSKMKVQEILTTTDTASKKGLETIPVDTIDSIRSLLEKEGVLVFKGLAGCGKTFLGLYVLAVKDTQGYTPVVLQTCTDLKRLLKAIRSSERRYVVLIDDVLGQFSLDKNELNVMNRLSYDILSVIQNSRILFVFTIRVNILKSVGKEQSSSKVLLKATFDVMHDTFNKDNLVRLYASMKDINLGREHIQTLSQTIPGVVGFPFLCSHMHGNFQNINSLFQKPTECIKNELIKLNTRDDTEFSVLLLVLITSNHLNIQTVLQYRNELEQIRTKYQCFPFDKSDLQSMAEHFVGTYLQEEGGVYHFIHDYILEAVYETALHQIPEVLMSVSPLEYINKFTYLFEHAKDVWKILVDRFSCEKNVAELAKCNLWQNLSFLKQVLTRCGTDIFFVSRNSEGASLFEYLCGYSSDSAIKKILRALNKTDLVSGHAQYVIERALKAACLSGRLNILKSLLSRTHVPITDDLIFTTIETSDCVSLIEFLLTNGGNIKAKNSEGRSILYLATMKRNTCLIDFLFGFQEQEMVEMTTKAMSDEFLISAVQSGSEALIKTVRNEILASNESTDYFTAIAASLGDAELFLRVIGHDLLHSVDENGWNILHKAICLNSVKVVERLIELGISYRSKTNKGSNILHIGSVSGSTEVVKYILHKFEDIAKETDIDGWNALHYAAYGNSVKCLEQLLTIGLQAGSLTKGGHNILLIAVQNGNTMSVEYILNKQKHLLEMTDNEGFNALHYSAMLKTKKCFELLVDAGLNVESRTKSGENVVHIATKYNSIDILEEVLLVKRDMIYTTDDEGLSAIHYAALKSTLSTFVFIEKSGARMYEKTPGGLTILHLAAMSGNIAVLKHITKKYCSLTSKVDYDGFDALHQSVLSGNKDCFNHLLTLGLQILRKTGDGRNSLHLAVQSDSIDILKYVCVSKKCVLLTKDSDNWNYLHYAAKYNSTQSFNYLLEFGVKPDCETQNGLNILHIAAMFKNIGIMKTIVHKFPQLIETTDNDGWNALHHSSASGCLECFQFLLELGIKIDSRTIDGRCVIHIAASNDKMGILKYIVQMGRDILFAVDDEGCNALHHAAFGISRECLDYLIEAGISPYRRTSNGRTVLHLAVFSDDADPVFLRYIISNYKGLIIIDDNKGRNALHYAHVSGSSKIIECIDILIDKGTNPNSTDKDGRNLLHLAVEVSHCDIIRYMLTVNRQLLRKKDGRGRNVFDIARGNPIVEELLDSFSRSEKQTEKELALT